MSLALKFTSLAIRTLSKPIANFIKRQAREHDGFRRTCISFAQGLHRIDMRWRLGLLQDAAAIEKQVAKDAAKDAAKKHRHDLPTVKTEAQTKADQEAAKAGKESTDAPKPQSKPRIRPLSEAKAIESGANFISEGFLFGVAASLIIFESWRSRRKETNRRDDVADRLNDLEESEAAARRALVELEKEVLFLRAKEGSSKNTQRILPKEVYEPERDEDEAVSKSWLSRITSFMSREVPDSQAKEIMEERGPGPAEKILVQSDKDLLEVQRKRREEGTTATPAAAATK